MSGQWPPGWDDPDDNIPVEADQQDTEVEAGLSEVAAYLASVPAPAMPGSVEARISAALAVEAASRAGVVPANGDAERGDAAPPDGTVQWDQAVGVRVLRPVPARARARRREVPERRPQRDVRKVLGRFVIGPLAFCLLLAVIVFGLSRGGGSSSSSSANSLAGAPAAASSSASAAGGQFQPEPSAPASVKGVAPVPASSSAGFVVTESGTRYRQATLAQQARAQVLADKVRESVEASAPAASSASSGAAASYALAPALRGCVLKVTGGVPPELVDRATYQGTPAYVIASSSRVWVVGLGCSAARPQVIASVPLAG